MTKGTRYFIAAASLIMVAVLGTGLVAYFNGGLPLAAFRNGPDDLAYVPSDASMVAYANVRDIMNSEFRQKLRETVPTGEARDQFLGETGIDIERDVTSVLVATATPAGATGAVDMKTAHDNSVALVRGVFSTPQIEASAMQHGATVGEYNGKRMITMGETGKMAVAFLEPSLLAVGDAASVRRAIDAKDGVNITANAEMMRLVGELDGNNNAWAVGRVDDLQKVANLPEQIKAQIPAVQWFAITGHVNGGLSGTIRLEARDDQAAENLRDVVRGAMALARLQMGHDQNIDTVINSLQMTGTGKTVAFSFAVPSTVVDSLAGFANGKVAPHMPNLEKRER
jgi:hypothetical protein